MEITEREYLDLQLQVVSLKNQVDNLQNPSMKRNSFRDRMKEPVISGTWKVSDQSPLFAYASRPDESWNAMIDLAKLIYKPSPVFRMESRFNGYRQYPYISMNFVKSPTRKISDLTPEQYEISVQMLNELVPIYNRYFKATHQQVMYDPTGRGNYEPIGIINELID